MFSPPNVSSPSPGLCIHGNSLAIKCVHIAVSPWIAKILILHFHLIIVLTISERVIKKTTLEGGLVRHH